MIGDKRPYDVIPYFFSDLADWASLEYVGYAKEWDQVVFRGDREDGAFSAWYLRAGRVDAALSVGRSEDLVEARRMIEAAVPLDDPAALGDLGSDLGEIGSGG